MRSKRGLVAAAAAAALIGSVLAATGSAGAAGARTVGIGVDSASPAGHNFQYTDFFPRTGTTVHQGDVVDFAWSSAPDGFHNVAVLKAGETPAQAWKANEAVVPDPGDAQSPVQLNPVLNLGNRPPAGSGAPGACGDQTTPCAYDGSSDLIAPAAPTDGKTSYFVQVNAPAGSRINFVCLVHPGMAGSLRVVASTTSTTSDATLEARRRAQWASDTLAALRAERRANRASVSRRGDGTRLIRMQAGVTAGRTEVLEMLPQTVHIRPGDVVQWRYTAGPEIHTVTFPDGTNQGEPIVPACDASPTDTAFAPPTAGPPCGDPTKFELHIFPQPQGVTAISTPTTFGSSGLIAPPPAPFPSSFAFSFPSAGVFTYQCHIHDHMTGVVRVDNA